MEIKRAFIHGLESSGNGAKGTFFRKRYPDMIVEDFSGPFAARMEKLEQLLAGADPLILVGSSYGGLMAAVYACRRPDRVKKMVLLAPALHLEPFASDDNALLPMPVHIIHGAHDDVVPLDSIVGIARRRFMSLTFTETNDGHLLHETFGRLEWDELLEISTP
ncbi:MAG TPA: alpha/beta fold hydrolase [Acidobacteriota bacterium]|nr:alpha/beta fold hydrolase [Acidobacteriota bacterium]